MKIKTIQLLFLVTTLCFGFIPLSHGQRVLLDTDFAANVTNPPENIRWMTSGSDFRAPGQDGSFISLSPPNNNRDVVAYFDQVDLAVGETLTLKYTVSIRNAQNRGSGFRIGLFSSNHSGQVSSNGFAPVFEAYTGYLLKSNPRSSSLNGTSLAIHKGNRLIAGSTNDYPNIYESEGSQFGADNILQTGFIAITNNGNSGVSISYQLPGRFAVETHTDTSHQYTSFDTIGFNIQESAGETITFHDMSLIVTP